MSTTKVQKTQEKGKSRRRKVYPKNPDNPSPSGDPYFDNPKNLEDLEAAIEELKTGKTGILLKTKEDIKRFIEDL